jgi:hypothetical protein
MRGAQRQQGAQPFVFALKLHHAGHALGLIGQLTLRARMQGARLSHAGHVVSGHLPGSHRHQQHLLHGLQQRGQHQTQRLRDFPAGVGHHQQNGQRRKKQQTCERRWSLLEKRGRRAIQRGQRHESKRTRRSAHPSRGLFGGEDAAQSVHALERQTTATHHAGQRVFGHVHW